MYTSTGESTFSSVPAFLAKLWTLVEDPATDDLICWDNNGKSFHVLDQARFAKEILPLYFKHNNIASFIRQLNMYGFRKVISTEAVNVKMENDNVEFAHQFFLQGQERLLQFIKRKVPNLKVGSGGVDDSSLTDARVVLSEMNDVKSRQDNMTVKLENLKLENEVLWREVASLRQMHMKQQHIVSKLIQFLVSVVGNQKHQLSTGLKRKAPLMLGDASTESTPVKLPRDDVSYQLQVPSGNVADNSGVTDKIPDLSSTQDNQHGLDISADATAVSGQAYPSAINTLRTDALEPLAILDSTYPPSLELTDIFDNSEAITAVPLDEVLFSHAGADTTNSVTKTTAAVTTSSPTNALAITDSKTDFDRHDLTSHLDMTYSQLSGLRELFTGSPQINFEPNLMLELFGYLDKNVPPVCVDEFHDNVDHRAADDSDTSTQTKSQDVTRPNIVGNEVIQYMPVEDFSSLYDISDVISPTFDGTSLDGTLLATPVDVLDTVNLLQPNTTTTTSNGLQVNVMEDVD